MKKIILLLLLTPVGFFVKSQYNSHRLDSLKYALITSGNDTSKIMVLNALADIYQDANPDSSIYFANDILRLAQQYNSSKWTINGYAWMGKASMVKGNYPLALEIQLKRLKIAESINDLASMAGVYNSVGNIYKEQQDYENAISNYKQCKTLAWKINDMADSVYALMNLGFVYEKTNQLDSALFFEQQAYQLAIRFNAVSEFGYILYDLANIHTKLGNKPLALTYYKMGVEASERNGNARTLAMNLFEISKYFHEEGKTDSAIAYAKKAFLPAQKASFLRVVSEIYRLLASLYESQKNIDSAFAYQKLYTVAHDSLTNRDKISQVQNISYTEQLRRQKMQLQIEKDREERKSRLQYAGIAVGLVAFIILFFLFSRSIIANQKLIRFLGVVALLIGFEFIDLFLHPYLGNLTLYSPLLMLLSMVCIAGLLGRLHHHLENWITHRLVEKNKKIRLAVAKKIIADSEKEDPG
ncbi:MAG: tetratricopeptide repeat protein [Chitinophagales bacterium]